MATQDVTLVWSPGTGESYKGDRRKSVLETRTMGTALAQKLDPRVYGAWAGYDATFGPVGASGPGGESHHDSRQIGKARVLEVAREHPGFLMIGGYSQGGEVSWELMQEMHRGQHADVFERVIGFVNISNPCRTRSSFAPGKVIEIGNVQNKIGWGVANRTGTGEVPRRPVFEAVNPADAMCNADPDSLLRDLNDLIDRMEFELNAKGQITVPAITAWLLRALSDAHRRNQLATLLTIAPFRITRAVLELRGYLDPKLGEHTLYANPARGPYGNGVAYTTYLAQAVNAKLPEMIAARR